MATAGTIRTDETLLTEAFVNKSLNNLVLGTNQTTTVVIVSYTMPMTGYLAIELLAQANWSGNFQGIGIHLAASTPAPSVYWGADCVENGLTVPPVWGQAKTWSVWTSLAVGTVVNIVATLSVGIFVPNVTWATVFGTIRAYRS
jgi:hypothetical protein